MILIHWRSDVYDSMKEKERGSSCSCDSPASALNSSLKTCHLFHLSFLADFWWIQVLCSPCIVPCVTGYHFILCTQHVQNECTTFIFYFIFSWGSAESSVSRSWAYFHTTDSIMTRIWITDWMFGDQNSVLYGYECGATPSHWDADNSSASIRSVICPVLTACRVPKGIH